MGTAEKGPIGERIPRGLAREVRQPYLYAIVDWPHTSHREWLECAFNTHLVVCHL
jgi:hypothetical protein